jgi:hypothetical protein
LTLMPRSCSAANLIVMNTTGAAQPSVTAKPKSLIERLEAALTRRREPEVLVWVNTVHGPKAVPVKLRDLR